MSMLRKMKIYQKRYLKYDFTSGIVVFLVAIPLCLGVALASGAPLFSGIISGIIGGIIVGALSESAVSVSGPAAGMVAVIISALAELGGFQIFLMSLVLAGILQIIFGMIRAGFLADYIPSNVIQGLLCAIGILIIIKQLPLAFMHPAQNQPLMETLKEASENFSIQPLYFLTKHINLGAVVITLISLAILIGVDATKNEKLKFIPAPIVVVILGVLLNEVFDWLLPSLTQDSAQLVNIPLEGGILGQLRFPDFRSLLNSNVYLFGFSIAALASLETLLNLEAAEKLDKRRRYCSRNRELFAQGIGNTLAGLVGGIPITSVVVRSSVNIQTGAKTKLATIFHGILIVLAVALVPDWLNRIPLASLAAILIYVGYKLTKVSIYKEMYAQGYTRFIPFLVTVIAIVFTNLLMGILIGLFISFFFILRSNSKMRLDIIQEKHPSGEVKRLILPQQVTFLNKAALIAELESIPPHSHFIIDARYTQYIDKDILELIKDFHKNQAPDKEISLNLIGFKERYDIHDHTDFITVTTYDVQAALNPEEVLTLLKEGNLRFLKDQRIHRSLSTELAATAAKQHPIATVLSCIDSRVPVETIFDMGLGDLFTVRVAGNVINDDILASIEFACHSGAKLILIMGHTGCGAIRAACDHVHNGHLTQLLEKIEPAVEMAKQTIPNPKKDDPEFIFKVTQFNIQNALNSLYENSEIIRKYLQERKIGLVSALYDVYSGTVTFNEFYVDSKN